MNLLAVYFALFIGMGIYEYIKRKDFEEFAVAGRRCSATVAGISITASCVGASATIGMTGLAFSVGTPLSGGWDQVRRACSFSVPFSQQRPVEAAFSLCRTWLKNSSRLPLVKSQH